MKASILARLARVEDRLRPAALPHIDMSNLTDEELQTLSALPRDETELRALIESPEYDWMPLARILERLR